MDAAEIDVGCGIFECGQTYVALSRVKSLDGLYLTSFDAKRIRINKKVKEFYESLTLYHETNEDIYAPLVIDEPNGSNNFINYQYVEPKDKYNETSENITSSNVKIIKIIWIH